MAETEIISHWDQLLDGLQHSSQAFYQSLAESIKRRQLPDSHVSRVSFAEGGLFSGKREYLRVQRKEYIFDVCAAPFGSGFFVSWWLVTNPGCLSIFADIPFLRHVVKSTTYWVIDSALMFQTSVHAAVLEVVDGLTETKGIRALSEFERKPVMKGFFKR